jgi:hypothetical protein
MDESVASWKRAKLPGGIALADAVRRTVGVGWALVMVSLLVAGQRDRHQESALRVECGTDPLDILRIGEIVEASTLHFLVDAHCSNARYLSDERIELRYRGQAVEVETRKLSVGGPFSYYEVVSVGGWRVD